MSNPQSLNIARARALELASRLLVRELDAACLDALRAPDLRAALIAYDEGCGEYLDMLAQSGTLGLDEAAADFCGLFLLSKRTSPHASAWLEGDPAERGAVLSRSVEGWMDQLGIEIAAGAWGNLPRDHLAVLCGVTAIALSTTPPQGEQLARHIVSEALTWVPAFAAVVQAVTTNPLYRGAVRMVDYIVTDLCDEQAADSVLQQGGGTPHYR